MDNRDEIIQTQMDLISTLVNNNLRSMANDIWGVPGPKSPTPGPSKKPVDGPQPGKTPAPAAEAKPADVQQAAEEETPPERQGRGAQPHQHRHGLPDAALARAADGGYVAAHGVLRQPRHRQDDDRPADVPHLQEPGHAA